MTHPFQELLQQEFRNELKANISVFDKLMALCTDLVKREFILHDHQDIAGVLFNIDGLVNTVQVDEILKTVILYSKELHQEVNVGPELMQSIQKNLIHHPSNRIITHFQEAIDGILSGDTVLLLDGCTDALQFSTRGWDARSIDEPQGEQVVRGPRDGFTENLRSNTALVRRRIRDSLLKVEAMKIGTKTKTDINLMYLEGTVKEGLVAEVKKRLMKIKIDGIIESGYVEELIEDSPYSPFTTVQSTERPDKVAASILEGRVAIIVDNTPFILIVPCYFWQFLQASDDYYSRFWVGSFFRIVRYIAFMISLTLPSIYVMLISFHQEMIPTPLALTIASGRDAVPFPVLLEAILMELAFELMREAGLRMPKPIGSAVSIVGSLVIGQAAVQAGVVSPFMVIVVAMTGIASFAIPNYAASFAIRLLRFPILLASGFMGLLGFAATISLIMVHIMSIRSFGEPYMSPATPFRPTDQKDIVIRVPWWSMQRKPAFAEGSSHRQAPHQIPKPPEQSRPGSPDQTKDKNTLHEPGDEPSDQVEKGRKLQFWRKSRHERKE